MASWGSIVGGILAGAGGIGQATEQARQDQLAQAKLDQEKLYRQSQLDLEQQKMNQAEAARMVSVPELQSLSSALGVDLTGAALPPEGKFARDLVAPMLTARAEQDKVRREQIQQAAEQDVIRKAVGAPEATLPPEAAMYSSATTIPATQPLPRNQVLATLSKSPRFEALAKILYPEDSSDWAPMGAEAPGLFQKRTGEVKMLPQAEGVAPTPPEGMQRTVTRGALGQVKSTVDRPIEARDDFDRFAQQITNPGTGQRYQRYEDLPANLQAQVSGNVEGFRGRIAAQTGAGAVTGRTTAEMALPVGSAASKYIHPQTGQSPPAMMALGDVLRAGYMEVQHPADRTALGDLMSTRATVTQLTQMADKLITAVTPAEAAVQGIKLHGEALIKSNPLATTYEDTRRAFLGTLSRTLGGERGVLTNQDIARINGALPSFFDTVAVKDGKKAILTNLLDTASEAKLAVMTGQPMSQAYKSRISDLITTLEEISTPKPPSVVTPGRPATPSQAAPGTGVEVVSPTGTHVWRNGQWQKR